MVRDRRRSRCSVALQAMLICTAVLLMCAARKRGNRSASYNGVSWLLFVNLAVFVADHVFHLPWVSSCM